jgi:hypothetical protein
MISHSEASFSLNDNAEFTIDEYNTAKPFSSFFPGVAGQDGIPMWTFYVNRGQCVCSMGVEDKDHAIMEFYPANLAYQMASKMGFRTFVKFVDETNRYYEPFQNYLHDKEVKRTQKMRISQSKLILEEHNETLGLTFIVEYCNVPNDDYAGLIRRLHIRNDTSESVTLDCLDGLPLIIPYGVDNSSLKFTRRLVEAFVEVDNLESLAPMFRGKVEPVDRPEVVRIKAGNFYIGFNAFGDGNPLVKPVVDPVKIFGCQTDYSYPERFLQTAAEDLLQDQILENRFPCAMGSFRVVLEAGATHTYASIIGHVSSVETLNCMLPRIADPTYVERKFVEDTDLIGNLLQGGFICSKEPALDLYAQQNYLDNGLRGGFPMTLGEARYHTAFYLYSRKHGDLERDYNHFCLSPSKYSQGNANYRDVNQNRRNDLFFNPDILDDNVEHFYNLIQLDGFNPLVIKEVSFSPNDPDKLRTLLGDCLNVEHVEAVSTFLENPFTPGSLMGWLQENDLELSLDPSTFLGRLLGICDRITDTEHGEGFWSDHWTYNLDLLENYLALYPENAKQVLFDKKNFTFYDNAHRVLPRADKYVLWDENAMQLNAVVFDEEKNEMIRKRSEKPSLVRTVHGTGAIYRTTLVNKILCLIVNKLASLDPQGVGVEMESDKPNWYDALNGLPGILGSSLSETLEIKRNVLFLQKMFSTKQMDDKEWSIFAELGVFLLSLLTLLNENLSAFEFWDKSHVALENYRNATRLGVSGIETMVSTKQLLDFFEASLNKLDQGIAKALDNQSGIPSTYFINEVVDYSVIFLEDGSTKLNAKGMPCFRAKDFKQIPLPLFLEGPVHYLRTLPEKARAAELAAKIRQSDLYDQKLEMYKVNAPLDSQPLEIGRARVFSPGWFENESIWLHMEYKYMLELLRNELYEEFYSDFKNVLVPFFDPQVYGRSTLENSSFIVSSANPDRSLHGNGFVARLSGATAEFIHMLLFMTVGRQPFQINANNELQLEFNPALPCWLFTEEARTVRVYQDNSWCDKEFMANSFSFIFLGDILVTYHNPERKNTFGEAAVSPANWTIYGAKGEKQMISGEALSGKLAEKIRNREVRKIEIELR